MAETFGMTAHEGEGRRHSGKWRYNIVAAVQESSDDLDSVLRGWFHHVAFIGFREPIILGNLFPAATAPVEVELEDIPNVSGNEGNHPVSSTTFGEDPDPPGIEQLSEYHSRAYAARYTTRGEAEDKHGKFLVLPLGNAAKEKDDGSWEIRIIQDFRRGGANLSAHGERIVFPRPVDHGWDLHDLWKFFQGIVSPVFKL